MNTWFTYSEHCLLIVTAPFIFTSNFRGEAGESISSHPFSITELEAASGTLASLGEL